jgi:coproporphyrinogen III oxidase-like Fe-S oxidoreductase
MRGQAVFQGIEKRVFTPVFLMFRFAEVASVRKGGIFMKKLSIYIHIPFCVKKCAYCDFISFRYNGDAAKAYNPFR